MQIFFSTLNQTLVLFIFMIIGFILKKGKFMPDNSSSVLSKLENIILVPAVVINTFMNKFTFENITAKWTYMIYSTVIVIVLIPIALFFSKLFAENTYEKQIYRYSFAFANFSFMGIALVSGAFNADVLFDYLIFIMPFYIVCYSLGVAWLIPGNGGKVGIKSFANPICISLVIGAAFGLVKQWFALPGFMQTALTGAGSCMGPIAMILTGFVIGGYEIKSLLKGWKVYVMSAIRLIFLPSIFILILKAINTPSEIAVVALISLAMPLGLNTVVIPAAYDGDTRLGASFALVSSVLGIITIPVMLGIFM
ncbi:MAG: AEC family transporter [Bacillota bacterium]|nr:AEC family transporter [Bacillota bacterium]